MMPWKLEFLKLTLRDLPISAWKHRARLPLAGIAPPHLPNPFPTILTESEGGTSPELVPISPSSSNNPSPSSEVNLRRSSRNSKSVDRLNYDKLGGD